MLARGRFSPVKINPFGLTGLLFWALDSVGEIPKTGARRSGSGSLGQYICQCQPDDGIVEVEAATGEEAEELALGERFSDIQWNDWRNSSSSEVVDVECEDPSEGAVLICPASNSNASLSALFEPVTATPQLPGAFGEVLKRIRELGVCGEDLASIESVMRRYAEQQ